MYIGQSPSTGAYKICDAITTSSTATYNLVVGSVATSPETANHCIVSLNGVIQAPISAFTISGSQIVFNSSLTSADVVDFILILGDVMSIGTPSDDTVTLAKMASGTDGNIISYDASGNPVAIATGSDGQVLTSTGAGSPPAFEAAAAGGKINQAITSVDQTQRTTTSTSFVLGSSTLTVDITPSASSSKILVLFNTNWGNSSSGISTWGTIFRDSTDLGSASDKGLCHHYSNSGNRSNASCVVLDSPSSTSALTYQFRFRVASGTAQINYDACEGSITVMEVLA